MSRALVRHPAGTRLGGMAVIMCAGGLILAACTTGSSTAPTSAVATTVVTTPSQQTAVQVSTPYDGSATAEPSTPAITTVSGSATHAAHVGGALTLNSGRFMTSVTVTNVIDPARVDPANQVPPTGDRFVGVEFDRIDTAPVSPIAETEEEYPATELAVVTGAGKKYFGIADGTTFGTLVGCTPSGDRPDPALGVQLMKPGQKLVDCIVYQIPKASSLSEIRYQDNDTDARPGGSRAGILATWTVTAK